MFGFKRKESCGLQILDHQVRIAKIRASSKGPHMKQFHTEPLPPGAIRNGTIIDEGAVARSVKSAVGKLGINGVELHLSIPASSSAIRKSVFPVVNDKELRNLIDVELNSSSQMPFKEPVFDFIRLGPVDQDESKETKKSDKKREEVLIFASPSNVVDSYVNAVQHAGLEPMTVELAPLATFRLLLQYADTINQRLSERIIVVHAEESYIEFSIFAGGIPAFIHTVSDMGGEDIYEENLTRELRRILNYFTYSISAQQETVQELYLFGDHSRMQSLPSAVSSVIEGPVQVIPLETWLDQQFDSIQSYAIPIGLALKGA